MLHRLSLLTVLIATSACDLPLLADLFAVDPLGTDAGTAEESEGEGEGDGGEGEGEGEPAPPCGADNHSPAAPSVVAPAANARHVVAAALVLQADGFSDEDGDEHAATRWQIRKVTSDDLELVWMLEATDDARKLSATLADGTFYGDSAATGALEDDEDYVLRVAFKDSSGRCNGWSAFSPDVAFKTDDGSAFFFDDSQVLTVALQLSDESIAAMNAQAEPPGCVRFPRDYQPGTFLYDGQVFDGVGVRIKGGCGSSRDLDGKPSLKVNLSWDDPNVAGCPETRRLFGQKSFTLNNGVQDRSAAHERLGYGVYRAAGVPAPRAVTVRLEVNGEYWGVYTAVETPDRRFLSRFFEDNDGMMYEGAYWCDIVPDNVPDGDEFTCFQQEFETDACDVPDEGADPTDWELLRGLASDIQDVTSAESFYPEVEAIIDMEELLSMWAVDSVLSHWDGYSFNIVNNYRIYHDPSTNLWSFIPWGIDQTFEKGGDVDPFNSSTVLMNACLDDAECEEAFAARLYEVIELFELMALDEQAAAIREQIRAHVYEDERREFSDSQWESAHDALVSWIGSRPQQVRTRLTNRGL